MRSTATLRPKALNFQETSSKLLQSVSKLLHRDGGLRPRDYQFMFQDVYALCTAYPQPFVKDLYALMKTFFTDHVAALRQVKIGMLVIGMCPIQHFSDVVSCCCGSLYFAFFSFFFVLCHVVF